MRTLGTWLAITVGIYLAIAVVMNAVKPARGSYCMLRG